MSLVFVTSNQDKFEEANALAQKYGVEIEHKKVAYVEIQSDNLEDIVKPSALQARKMAENPCFVEDSGLFIKALNGFPGPYSSYVYKTIGNKGILQLMKNIDDRRAEFKSAIGYSGKKSEPKVFVGNVKGTISKEERGTKGFGYDPIFIPDKADDETFAEMSTETKNTFSHRASAIEKFVKWYARNKKAEGDKNDRDS